MEPIFTDKDVRHVLEMNKLPYRNGNDDETPEYRLAKAVRDAVEDKFHILVEEDMKRRQTEGMEHVREIGRLLAEARRED